MRFPRAIFFVILVLTVACTTSCKHQQASTSVSTLDASKYSGGKGTSFDDAVIINEKSEGAGVDAEYAWLKAKYPGYKLGSQALATHNGKHYDIMSITTVDGEDKKIYFDISNFFGKW
jgi:hypothetical protein